MPGETCCDRLTFRGPVKFSAGHAGGSLVDSERQGLINHATLLAYSGHEGIALPECGRAAAITMVLAAEKAACPAEDRSINRLA
jgi:hypothetical protein